MYCVPPRVTSEPNVAPQHVIVCVVVLVLESLAFPPDVPTWIAPDCAFWFPGWIVTVALPEAELFACETALTVKVVVMLLPLPSDFVGTPLGATYNPLVDMNPKVWLPPAMPLTSQVTAVLGAPFTDAVNCCVPKFATLAAVGDTLTEVGGPVTVTVADADFVESACEVAVTVTCGGFGTVAGAVYSPVLEMVPFAAPPATLQATAVFDVPVTVAVNCCVLPTATLTEVGATEIVTVVLLDVPAQPKNRTETQARPLSNDAQRMKILTGGAGVPIQKQESKSGQHRKHTHEIGLLGRRKRCLAYMRKRYRFGTLRDFRGHSMSRQLAPTQISTSSGTASLYTFSISSRTNLVSSLRSLAGASNSSSSCTCRIILASNFSAPRRQSMAIIASLMRSAAVPCSGELSAVRSAKLRICTCGEVISGMGRMRPKSVFATPVCRVSASTLSRYCFTPR